MRNNFVPGRAYGALYLVSVRLRLRTPKLLVFSPRFGLALNLVWLDLAWFGLACRLDSLGLR